MDLKSAGMNRAEIKPFSNKSEHVLNATALPIEVISAPRGPMNQLATEMTTM